MQQNDFFLRQLETFILFLQKLLNKNYSDIDIIKSDLIEIGYSGKLINYIEDDNIHTEDILSILETSDERVLKAIISYFLSEDTDINREKVLSLIQIYTQKATIHDIQISEKINAFKNEK